MQISFTLLLLLLGIALSADNAKNYPDLEKNIQLMLKGIDMATFSLQNSLHKETVLQCRNMTRLQAPAEISVRESILPGSLQGGSTRLVQSQQQVTSLRQLSDSLQLKVPLTPHSQAIGFDYNSNLQQVTKVDESVFFVERFLLLRMYQLTFKPGKRGCDPAFLSALPQDDSNERYNDAIQSYGTHYISEMSVGGFQRKVATIRASTFIKATNATQQTSLAIQLLDGNLSASSGYSNEEKRWIEELRRTSQVSCFRSGDESLHLDCDNQSALHNWQMSIKQHPTPIELTLTPIHKLRCLTARQMNGLKTATEKYFLRAQLAKVYSAIEGSIGVLDSDLLISMNDQLPTQANGVLEEIRKCTDGIGSGCKSILKRGYRILAIIERAAVIEELEWLLSTEEEVTRQVTCLQDLKRRCPLAHLRAVPLGFYARLRNIDGTIQRLVKFNESIHYESMNTVLDAIIKSRQQVALAQTPGLLECGPTCQRYCSWNWQIEEKCIQIHEEVVGQFPIALRWLFCYIVIGGFLIVGLFVCFWKTCVVPVYNCCRSPEEQEKLKKKKEAEDAKRWTDRWSFCGIPLFKREQTGSRSVAVPRRPQEEPISQPFIVNIGQDRQTSAWNRAGVRRRWHDTVQKVLGK